MGFGKKFGQLFGDDPLVVPAQGVYEGIVGQARQPAFYALCGVPDNLDGRFELVALHAFLVLRRLKLRDGGGGLAQALIDVLIRDLDRSLREMDVGDLGVSRRVKEMARGFYGRIAAYEAGLDGSNDMLQAALTRNLYGTIDRAPISGIVAMTAYMRQEADSLDEQSLEDMMAGRVAFGPPPTPDDSENP
jgi:cytochrome b pre-mRNA-processing protein 3